MRKSEDKTNSSKPIVLHSSLASFTAPFEVDMAFWAAPLALGNKSPITRFKDLYDAEDAQEPVE